MAIPLGTNDLKIYRRHASYCTRYLALKNKPDTYRPVTKKDEKLDTCQCPIWCRGYLAKEIKIVKGKQRCKRIFAALDTSDWIAAEQQVARLYERGSLPSADSAVQTIDNRAVTVRHAAERYLQSRRDGSLNPIEPDTYAHYASLIDQRLIPFCDDKGIVYIRDFENKDVCSQFTESWRQLRRNTGELLAMTTRKTELERFRTFLRECVENGWMAKNGAEKIRFKNQKTAKSGERFGLELEEYEQMMADPGSADLTAQQNQETRAAAELMRWTGMRISDAHKFNDTEIVLDEKGSGRNAGFIQKKTKRRCVSPLPVHVVELLNALPGQMKNGRKHFFTCTYTALRMRIDTLADRAQQENPFAHAFSPHCLRHTFAIQHINVGTDVKLISKWLGHESVAVTLAHYGNWIKTTQILAEDLSREANAKMMAKVAVLRDQTKTARTNSSARPLATF
ncbi:MAG: tyrosine-type recombinase/integrase [Candidatus Solibacter sp.]